MNSSRACRKLKRVLLSFLLPLELPKRALAVACVSTVLGAFMPGQICLADEGGSSEGAESNDSEGGGCDGCDADQADEGEGDVCPEDKDCEDCSGGGEDDSDKSDLAGDDMPRPVAWDTGEKWESVVDLTVRVHGEDFELIRNYTSDPGLIPDLYNGYDFRGNYIGEPQYLQSPTNHPAIPNPSVSPQAGKGWSFANLRSLSLISAGGCEFIPNDPDPGSTLTLKLWWRAWLNRPGRKARSFAIPYDLSATTAGVGEGEIAGNQTFVVPEGGTFSLITGSPCAGSNVQRYEYTGLVEYHEPGKWFQVYDLTDSVGFITKHEDAFGNRRVYEDTRGVGSSNTPDGIADTIFLNGTAKTAASGDQAAAWIELFWEGTAADPVLVRAEVYRPTGDSTDTMTQYVEYHHLVMDSGSLRVKTHDGTSYTVVDDPSTSAALVPSTDLGKTGDLVHVAHYVSVDPSDVAADWRARITQYRYHRSGVTPNETDKRLNTVGKDHQLKMVFQPQQVEFVVQKRESATLSPSDQTVALGAIELLAIDDDGVIFTDGSSVKMYESAEKIVSYDTNQAAVANKTAQSPVDHQFIQAGDCGCAGGGSITAKYREFTQEDDWTATPPGTSSALKGQSMQITEYEVTNFASYPSSAYRTYSHDLLMLGSNEDKPYTWLKATIDETGSGLVWVSENLYDWDKRVRQGVYYPSTFAGYTRSTGTTAPAVTRVADGDGYMVEFGYEADNESVSTLRRGAKGETELISTTERINDEESYRRYLGSKRIGYRVAGSAVADDQEVTTYEYGYDATNPLTILWQKTVRKRELPTENGPGSTPTSVTSWDFYDDAGNTSWVIDEGGTIYRYEYDDLTGELAKISENVNKTLATTSNDPELDLTGSGNPFGSLPTYDTAAGTLVTEYEHDLIGRVTKSIQPGSVEAWTIREMQEDSERPGILYFATTSLPHEVGTGEYDGPAWVSFYDAASDTTRIESMPLTGTYDPDTDVYTLDSGDGAVLSRAVVTQELPGTVSKNRVWWDYGTTTTEKNRYYDTSYDYDAFGRLVSVTDPSDTIVKFEHDVLDRMIELNQNTVGSGIADTLLAIYYYDRDPAASVQQDVGNGNITRIATYTWDENSDGPPLAVGVRTVLRYHDERNRLVGVMPVENGPIQIIRYDNLDRPIEIASYKNDGGAYPAESVVLGAAATDPLPASIANLGNGGANAARESYQRIHYSQRGLRFRVENAINPKESVEDNLEWLASNNWYDADGNKAGSWLPNAPGVVAEFDPHDRPVKVSITDRLGDTAALGNGSRHGQSIDVTGDSVIEQYEYEYDSTSGVLELATTRRRLHDSTSTGALTSSNAITSYAGFLYDSAQRAVATIDFGTNKDEFSTGTTAPSLSAYSGGLSSLLADDDVLFSHYSYNDRGLRRDVTGTQDGDALKTRYAYDHLDRPIAVIENAVDVDEADISWSTNRYSVNGQTIDYLDRDRVTSFAYDGVNNVTARVAHIPESDGSGGSQESVQETRYAYGVTVGTNIDTTPMSSAVQSNRLLHSVNYPDESTGLADPTGTNSAYDHLRVTYAYNAQGQVKGITDQNGTTRWIWRDQMSHVLHDIVHTVGASVDDNVKRLTYTYDQLGRITSAASYGSATVGAGTASDEVTFTYTPLWQIKTVAQQHVGPVTASSPEVAYAYSNVDPSGNTGNHSRLTKLIYPSDFTGAVDINDAFTEDTVGYVYDSGIDDQISRPSTLQVDGWINTAAMADLISYERVGMGLTARAVLPYAGDVITGSSPSATWETVLDRTKDLDGSSTSGSYPALDGFGRVVHHMWARSDFGPHGSVSGLPKQPPILAVGVADHTDVSTPAYDRMSNKLRSNDLRPGAQLPFRDRTFTYDGLNRLASEERSPTPSGSYLHQHLGESWQLDMLGNWDNRKRDVEKDGDSSDAAGAGSDQVRTHNEANEIKGPTGSASYDMVLQNASGSLVSRYFRFAYDDNGNMTEQKIASALPVGGNPMPGLVMTYDAWNRLIKTEHGPSSGSNVAVSVYTYNALGWRTSKKFDSATGGYDGYDQKRVFLYDASWRLLEERIDTDTSTNSMGPDGLDDDADWVSQQFWGLRYIDDAVAKRVNRDTSDPDGWIDNSGVSRWYQISDAQFSVCAILTESGKLYERVEYDAYGNARHRPAGDAFGDGVASVTDIAALGGTDRALGDVSGLYHADYDLDFDGDSTYATDTSATDLSIAIAGMWFKAALPDGWISDPRSTSTGPDNSIGYAGYIHNSERSDYMVRNRVYEPSLGRWRQRDPIGYAGGGNLNECVLGNPVKFLDPLGLEPHEPMNSEGVPASQLAKCERLRSEIEKIGERLKNRLWRRSWWQAVADGKIPIGISRSAAQAAMNEVQATVLASIAAGMKRGGSWIFSLVGIQVFWDDEADEWDRAGAGALLGGTGALAFFIASANTGAAVSYITYGLIFLGGGPGIVVGAGFLIVVALTADSTATAIGHRNHRKHAKGIVNRINNAIDNDMKKLEKLTKEFRCQCSYDEGG